MCRRSTFWPLAASASAMSSAVTEPKSLSCSPTFRATVTDTALMRLACSSALPRSLAWRAEMTARSCSSWRDVGLVRQHRQLPGQEVVAAEAGLHVDQLARLAQVGDVLAQNDLHRHGVLAQPTSAL